MCMYEDAQSRNAGLLSKPKRINSRNAGCDGAAFMDAACGNSALGGAWKITAIADELPEMRHEEPLH